MTRVAAAFGALLINSAYLAASSSPTLFYFSNILIHIALGIALAIVCLRPWGFSAGIKGPGVRRHRALALSLTY